MVEVDTGQNTLVGRASPVPHTVVWAVGLYHGILVILVTATISTEYRR